MTFINRNFTHSNFKNFIQKDISVAWINLSGPQYNIYLFIVSNLVLVTCALTLPHFWNQTASEDRCIHFKRVEFLVAGVYKKMSQRGTRVTGPRIFWMLKVTFRSLVTNINLFFLLKIRALFPSQSSCISFLDPLFHMINSTQRFQSHL